HQPLCPGILPQRDAHDGNFQVLTRIIAIGGNANGGRLQRGHPLDVLYALVDLAAVGCCRCAVLHQQRLGHTAIHACGGGEVERGDDVVSVHSVSSSGRMTSQATTSKSSMPANSPVRAWVPPGVNRLATARSSLLPTTEETAAASSFCGWRMSWPFFVALSKRAQAPASGRSRPTQRRFNRSRICLACGYASSTAPSSATCTR